MVEDLRRYTQALRNDGWAEAAKELMDKAEELRREGKLPEKVVGVTINVSKSLIPEHARVPEVLTAELAERLRVVMGVVDDTFQVVNFLSPESTTVRKMERHSLGHRLEITPPDGWAELALSMNKKERVAVSKVFGDYCSAGIRRNELYDAGTIRRSSVDALMEQRNLGKIAATFIKTAFESVNGNRE